MGRLWLHLVDVFGHRWVANFGKVPPRLWQAALADLSEAELMAGLRGCLSWRGEFVPTLPEFLALCRAESAARPVHVRLAEPAAVREARRRAGLAALRKIRGDHGG